MKLFVTGGTGFIGSHFLRSALAEGHEVTALRRAGSTPPIALPAEPTWLERRMDEVTAIDLSGQDALVHFAAQGVSPQKTDWNQAFEVNVRQSVALFATALEAGLTNMVACGSCMEYGACGDRFEFIPPDAPLEPVGPYAASKAAFAIALQAMAAHSSVSVQLLRPFHLYGEGQHEANFWPALRHAAQSGLDYPMTPGDQVRDFSPVEDAAAAFLAAVEHPPVGGGLHVQNLGSGRPVTLRDFAADWWSRWQATGSLQPGALPYRPGEVMRYVPLVRPHPLT